MKSICLFSILSVSLSYDVKLPNGQADRHPNADKFIDAMRERLNQAIRVYEQTPLGKQFCRVITII